LSGGRLTIGVGLGWNRAEWENSTGIPAANRAAATGETIEAMRALWESDVANYNGKFVKIAPSWSWPKPVQRPLPVLLGVRGTQRNFERLVEWGCQGWMPMSSFDDDTLPHQVDELRRIWSEAGKDPDALRVITSQQPDELPALRRAIRLALETRIDLSLYVTDRPRDELLRHLDTWVKARDLEVGSP
jgi:alkanesulfonate monooxygenase SsuD/methylene tetrahydromethanopterin reductase-like flavin-dependent oxidoreductase (luciferase family)